jgi:hypothetical protein
MSAADSHHATFVLTTAALADDFRASIPKWTFNHGEVTADRNVQCARLAALREIFDAGIRNLRSREMRLLESSIRERRN